MFMLNIESLVFKSKSLFCYLNRKCGVQFSRMFSVDSTFTLIFISVDSTFTLTFIIVLNTLNSYLTNFKKYLPGGFKTNNIECLYPSYQLKIKKFASVFLIGFNDKAFLIIADFEKQRQSLKNENWGNSSPSALLLSTFC